MSDSLESGRLRNVLMAIVPLIGLVMFPMVPNTILDSLILGNVTRSFLLLGSIINPVTIGILCKRHGARLVPGLLTATLLIFVMMIMLAPVLIHGNLP